MDWLGLVMQLGLSAQFGSQPFSAVLTALFSIRHLSATPPKSSLLDCNALLLVPHLQIALSDALGHLASYQTVRPQDSSGDFLYVDQPKQYPKEKGVQNVLHMIG